MAKTMIDGPPQSSVELQCDLQRIGVRRGVTLMVHSSLSSIGWVVGGPATVVTVIQDAVGVDGTTVMPSATPYCADPATWKTPRVPDECLEKVREHLPVFDIQTTPTSMGAIPEAFRNWPGTVRSNHPLESICARGPLAAEITSEHSLAFSEGRGGLFGKLFDLDSWVLLVGVGFNRCTALHFAESLSSKRRVASVRFPVQEEGRRVWVEVPNVADDLDTHFPVIGRNYLSAGRANRGRIGEAESVLFPMRDLVGFAADYFEATL